MPKLVRDRFDDAPRTTGRVGAHRAENPGTSGWIVLLWSIVAVLVLVVVGIFGTLTVMGRISLFPGDQPSVVTAGPTTAGEIDMSYSVMILNATPEAGLEDQARDTLLNAGWGADLVIATDGASDDFAQTTVFYVDAADEKAAIGLAGIVGGAQVQQSDFYADLNDTGGPQLTVVIGLDRTEGGGASPTP